MRKLVLLVKPVTKTMLKNPNVIEPEKSKLRTGIYLDENAKSIIIYKVTLSEVFGLLLDGKHSIENMCINSDRFAKRFYIHLPSYPVRRAARIYLESLHPKNEGVDRILRVLVNK